jgi:hypothetical protein
VYRKYIPIYIQQDETLHSFELRVSVHHGLMNKIPTRCSKSSLFSSFFSLHVSGATFTHHYTFYLYLETALHVSGGTSTQHQERIHLYLEHLLFVTPLLLSAAILEELEPV